MLFRDLKPVTVGDVSSNGALRDICGSSGGANLDLLMTRWKTYYGALYDLVEGCVTSVDHLVKVQLDLVTCWHGYWCEMYDLLENFMMLADHLMGQTGLSDQLAKFI
jgi:hypothetical protein